MRRVSFITYLMLFLALVIVLNLPFRVTHLVREKMIGLCVPFWTKIYSSTRGRSQLQKANPLEMEMQRLRLEKQFLQNQIESLRSIVGFEERVFKQINDVQGYKNQVEQNLEKEPFFRRRIQYLAQLLDLELQAIPAQVIFRDPALWSSFVWINIGEKDNHNLKKTIVSKNSPVLSDGSLVGVVEEVLENRSRVRLITDSQLTIAVRAVRDQTRNHPLIEKMRSLALLVKEKLPEVLGENEEKDTFMVQLDRLLDKLSTSSSPLYLAKGELRGKGNPLWRSLGVSLAGIGFNYFEADEDLVENKVDPLIKEGDILLTSGLDGVFPADLPVALVSKVIPSSSGSLVYDLEAQSLVDRLDALSSVFVLPPLSNFH